MNLERSTHAATVEDAITSRQSIRRFLDTPVPRELISRLLQVAGRAPSGSNIQPWRVYVLDGARKQALVDALLADHADGMPDYPREYNYYPLEFPEPYLARRRACGWGLYGALGIERGENERMTAQHARNYAFFDAPVGMIFTIDDFLQPGSWLDYGMFLQSIMVAARGHGLHTCAQAAFATYHKTIREQLSVPDGQTIICGMSLGYADPDAPENAFTPEREPVEAYTTFVD
ncbi:MAG: nitroreductase [Rhodospirillaceae bacterium]|jgi:nitroreductase|nr:nitroreductase [Rhodospirillaceae bacterium]